MFMEFSRKKGELGQKLTQISFSRRRKSFVTHKIRVQVLGYNFGKSCDNMKTPKILQSLRQKLTQTSFSRRQARKNESVFPLEGRYKHSSTSLGGIGNM